MAALDTVTIQAVPFARPSIGGAEIREVLATLESGWLTMSDTTLSLPLSVAMSDDDVTRVIDAVQGACAVGGRRL